MNNSKVDSDEDFRNALEYFSTLCCEMAINRDAFPLSVEVTQHDDEPDKLIAFVEMNTGHLFGFSWPKRDIELTRDNLFIMEAHIFAEFFIRPLFVKAGLGIN